MMTPRPLAFGDPAPRFRANAIGGLADYSFDTVAGRPILLLFCNGAASAEGRAALQAVASRRECFDDTQAAFFGITTDPADWQQPRVAPSLPGIRFLADPSGKIRRLFSLSLPQWLLLDRNLRVVAAEPIADAQAIFAALNSLIDADAATDFDCAPILVLPRVFEPEFCQSLIEIFERNGGQESGFMREVGGKTVEVVDHSHKRRSDVIITDQSVITAIHGRIIRRLLPAIASSFHFRATRMERNLVARYDAENGGHFRPHRDNTTRGTAHRRFAVTLNLNAGDYDGGDLRFPEFGMRTYRAPTGGAVVFSCSLLHEATPVTRGQRFAFLPFLYDDEAAAQREANNIFLGDDVAPYQRTPGTASQR